MSAPMNAAGLGVTPELLSAAADEIDAAVRGGGIDCPPTPAGGANYGHPGMADAVGLLGSAIRAATEALLAGAERNSTGLRAGANAYLAQEQAALRAIGQGREPGPAGLAGPVGLAGLMGVTDQRRAG